MNWQTNEIFRIFERCSNIGIDNRQKSTLSINAVHIVAYFFFLLRLMFRRLFIFSMKHFSSTFFYSLFESYTKMLLFLCWFDTFDLIRALVDLGSVEHWIGCNFYWIFVHLLCYEHLYGPVPLHAQTNHSMYIKHWQNKVREEKKKRNHNQTKSEYFFNLFNLCSIICIIILKSCHFGHYDDK